MKASIGMNSRTIVMAALMAGAASLALSVPADSQESILPPGFGTPDKPKSEPKPKADPKPKAEPKKAEPKKVDKPKSESPKDAPKEEPKPTVTPTPAPALPDEPREPTSSSDGDANDTSLAPSRPRDTAGDSGTVESSDAGNEDTEDGANDEITRVRKYDLPAGSRRSLDRIGPLTAAEGGMPTTAFWGAGGNYLSILMDKTNAPLVSRWGSILLRRALVSSVDTPTTINGADVVAARASLLLRMGEANAARDMIQSVDPDKATPKLLQAALQTYMANADPGGLCPLVPKGLQTSKDVKWELARGMCTAMSGDAGTAGVIVDRAMRKPGVEAVDGRLAEKILGASTNGRRAVKIEWDNVKQLTPWRFGLATATGVDIPANLLKTETPQAQAWQSMTPMTSLNVRSAAAPVAASLGVLSNRAYVDLLSAAYDADTRDEKVTVQGDLLRTAYVGATLGERLKAIRQLWAEGSKDGDGYDGLVLTARAAARLPVTAEVGDDMGKLIASMLSAGLDSNAAAWASVAEEGSDAWGQLALAAPTPLKGVDSGSIGSFIGNDNSANSLKSKIFVAALAGLGRIDQETFTDTAGDLEMNLSRQSDWAVAIQKAADDDQQGTVALLAAVGLQGENWGKMNPLHLYHITAALRKVGLNAEARMIAAEAVARSG